MRYRAGMRSRVLAIGLLAAVLPALSLIADAEQRRFRSAPATAGPESFDGAFHYCRVWYQSNRGGFGGGWLTDYPDADLNLSIRLSELTKIRVSRNADGDPNHLIVRLADDELFNCPFIMMQEVGAIYIDDDEAARLREYLLKGGFLWVDDFWGRYAWEVWASQISKVLPPGEYPIVDLKNDHPLFRTMFQLPNGVPQVPSINFWLGSGGGTSERGADSADVHARGIFDKAGHLMVLQTHNTDISDSWEREAADPDYFYRFSVEGYAVAVNVALYALTH
jgi:hypothetical protein